MLFILATNGIASRPPEHRLTGTQHARAKTKGPQQRKRPWHMSLCSIFLARATEGTVLNVYDPIDAYTSEKKLRILYKMKMKDLCN